MASSFLRTIIDLPQTQLDALAYSFTGYFDLGKRLPEQRDPGDEE